MSFKAPLDALNTKKLLKYPHALNPLDISRSHQTFHSLSQKLSTKSPAEQCLELTHVCCVYAQCSFLAGLPNGLHLTPQDPIRLIFLHTFLQRQHIPESLAHMALFS